MINSDSRQQVKTLKNQVRN